MTTFTRVRTVRPLAALLAAVLVGTLALTGCSTLTGEDASTTSEGSGPVARLGTGAEGAPAESGIVAAPEAGGVMTDQSGASQPSEKGTTPAADKLIIVTKTLRMQVEKVDDSIAKIRTLVARDGGDISALQVSTDTGSPVYRDGGTADAAYVSAPLQAYVTVRVPTKTYSRFIADAVKLGKVTYQSETADDVTQQHVDLKARLKNLKAEETRYRQFLAQAKNVTEALRVERELERVRGEIESLQAQIDYLERQAAMATVTIEMAEPQAVVRPEGEDWGFTDAITTGIQGMASVINFIIVVVLATAPLWISGLLITWLVVVLVRRHRAKVAAGLATEPVSDEQLADEFQAMDAPQDDPKD